jgi:hypothetical protein
MFAVVPGFKYTQLRKNWRRIKPACRVITVIIFEITMQLCYNDLVGKNMGTLGIMKKIILVIACLLLPSGVYCFQDKIAVWSDVNMAFDTGDRISISQDKLTLTSLSLTWDERTIEVPVEDLKGISFPHINTLYVSYGEFHVGDLEGVPYRIINFRYGLEEDKSFGEFPEANFLFYKGRYQERRVRRKDSPSSWKHEIKERGKPAQAGGTERRIK